MKKTISLLLSAVLLFTLFGCGAKETAQQEPSAANTEAAAPTNETAGNAENAETLDLLGRIQKAGVITIATEGVWAPWTYHDESGALTGMDVELGRLIAAELGVEAQFAETNWDSILAGVSAGRFDLAINGVGYTEERAKSYHFTTPYVYIQSVLVVAADNDEIHSFEDLAGKTTANTASSTYASVAEEYGATVTPVDDLLQTMLMVQQGRVDATINAKVSVEEYLSQHPDAPVKVAAESEGEVVVIPIALGEDAQSLHDAVDAALETLRENGKLAELSERFFGADLTNPA